MYLLKLYPLAAVPVALVLLAGVFLTDVFWRRLTLVLCAATFCPFISADYRLTYFIIPLLLFAADDSAPKARLTCWLFALLMIPKHFFYFDEPEVSVSAVLTPLIGLTLGFSLFAEDLKTFRAKRKSALPATAEAKN